MPSGTCNELSELPSKARAVLTDARRAVLATVDRDGNAHAVPVCFALRDAEIVTAVDQKPKRKGRELTRVSNVRQRGDATMLVDRWDEDWSRLGWVMVQGSARIEEPGRGAPQLLERYPQYRDDPPHGEVIALRPKRILWWTWQ